MIHLRSLIGQEVTVETETSLIFGKLLNVADQFVVLRREKLRDDGSTRAELVILPFAGFTSLYGSIADNATVSGSDNR